MFTHPAEKEGRGPQVYLPDSGNTAIKNPFSRHWPCSVCNGFRESEIETRLSLRAEPESKLSATPM